MKFFLDTASLEEISEAVSWGAVAGVTTNPTLYARVGGKLQDFEQHIKKICALVKGPVSAEVTAPDTAGMLAEGRALASLADNVAVKVPLTLDGLAATRALANEGIEVNMTLVFSVPQAILAARAGARYVSPFVGRFDDIAEDGIEQLSNIVMALGNYDFAEDGPRGTSGPHGRGVEVIAASIRNPNHVTQAALVGADIATVPFGVLKKCAVHPLTTNGLAAFEADWEKVKQA
ncbi:MAG: transaldolase family protein [Coriobacteriales bacterium]|nr:transaldolase family protein [Coriobacteriales bacterium]